MRESNLRKGKNLIPLIAKELGLDLEEVFYLDEGGTKYKFTDKHLMYYNNIHGWRKAPTAMMWIINGKLKVRKVLGDNNEM